MITQHRAPSHGHQLPLLLILVGGLSAAVLATSTGAAQLLAGAIALIAPVLAHRALSRATSRTSRTGEHDVAP